MKATNQDGKLRLGLIGCGQIAELGHLPAALSCPGVELTALSDPDEKRLRVLRRHWGLDVACVRDYRETFGLVDAVILATPNYLHAPMACDYLGRSVHVLCEKPLALDVAECERVLEAAEAGSAVLAVGHFTRFYRSTELTRRLIDEGVLGPLESFDYELGVGRWSTVSGFNLSRATSGGGVLIENGVHFVDRMLHVFPGVRPVRCAHDARGGVEANCLVDLRGEHGGRPLAGRITLSRTHRLANRLQVVGEVGRLLVGDGQRDSVTFVPARGGLVHEITPAEAAVIPTAERDYYYFRAQLIDFVGAIRTGRPPRVAGREAAESIRLIEDCYRMATSIDEPWVDVTVDQLDGLPAIGPGAPVSGRGLSYSAS